MTPRAAVLLAISFLAIALTALSAYTVGVAGPEISVAIISAAGIAAALVLAVWTRSGGS